MITLLLVRHSQASFGAENYDVLSSLGVKQSQQLGTWLARRAIHLHAIWSGPLKRQLDTAHHLISAAAEKGLHFPAPEILDDFRELPAPQLVQHILPQINKESIGCHQESAHAEDAPSALELALEAWARGSIDVGELECFDEFNARIQRALKHVLDRTGPKQCVAVITSAGPIAAAMRLALNLDNALTMKLGGVIANSTITEFRFNQGFLKLVGFNFAGHLEREEVTQF